MNLTRRTFLSGLAAIPMFWGLRKLESKPVEPPDVWEEPVVLLNGRSPTHWLEPPSPQYRGVSIIYDNTNS